MTTSEHGNSKQPGNKQESNNTNNENPSQPETDAQETPEPTPGQEAQPGPTSTEKVDPAYPLAGLEQTMKFVRHTDENHEDRRKMRRLLFAFIVMASAVFLFLGAVMSVVVIVDMTCTKRDVKNAMIKVVNESSPRNVQDFLAKSLPIPPESLNHARETAQALNIEASKQRSGLIDKFLETTNWLSLTPMITLIAFILGVGLTLSIALMRALFKEEEEVDKSHSLSAVSTPLSKLLEYLVEFLQSKFKKS